MFTFCVMNDSCICLTSVASYDHLKIKDQLAFYDWLIYLHIIDHSETKTCILAWNFLHGGINNLDLEIVFNKVS
jgi:hypothetical protein